MTLNSHPQFEAALKKIKDKAQRISSSWPRMKQKDRLLQSVVRPIATYPFSVAPYSDQELAALDRVLTQAYKKAYQQRNSMSNALARADKWPWGHHSHG